MIGGQVVVKHPGISFLLTQGKKVARRSYLVFAVILAGVVGWSLSPYFLTRPNLLTILITGSVISVLAVGQFMVIVTAGIDLSVGSITALSTVLVALMMLHHMGSGLAVLLTLLASGGIGTVNGLLVVFGGITPFIVTLGMLSIISGAAFLIQGPMEIIIGNGTFLSLFYGDVIGVNSSILWFVGVLVVFAAVMRWTTFGRQLYAIGGNPEAARFSGLPVKRDLVSVYAISGLLAGLGGLMLAGQLAEGSSLVAANYNLNAIAAAVVGGASLFGGTGSPFSAVVGGLLIGMIQDILNLKNVPAQETIMIQGALILVAVYATSGRGASLARYARSRLLRVRKGNGGGSHAGESAGLTMSATSGEWSRPASIDTAGLDNDSATSGEWSRPASIDTAGLDNDSATSGEWSRPASIDTAGLDNDSSQ
jgi:ribose transport system permease protein